MYTKTAYMHMIPARNEYIRVLKTQWKQVIQGMYELVFVVLEGEGR